MLVVMRTFSSDYYNNDSYDYAIFKMETAEAQIVARHLNVYKLNQDSVPNLTEMVFSAEDETACEFFSCSIWDKNEMDNMPSELRKDIEGSGWGVLPEDYEREFTPKDAQLPEALFFVVCPDGFFWRALPQGAHLIIESEVLPRELLARVL